jgi:DNA polymerase I-like protein with 3'-5' exonuclease and polymerase domains
MTQPSLPDDLQLHFVNDFDSATQLMSWLGSRDLDGVLGVDTETTGLERDAQVRLFQVGGHKHGWAIPFEDWRGLCRDICRRWDGQFTFHNAPFDQPKLKVAGVDIPIHRIDDTMTMSHILEPHISKALKTQASRHVDSNAAAGMAELDKAIKHGGWDWDTVPIAFQPYWTYGALDPVLTLHLHDHHKPLIIAQRAIDSYELERGVQWVTLNMETYGAHIDAQYTQVKLSEFTDYVTRADEWVKANYGCRAGSNDAIIEVLRGEGYDFDKRTAGGKLSLDRDVLEGVDHPLAHTVLKRRQLQKLASTYLSHFLAWRDGEDLIHPNINPLGARTGRMSITQPALQTLPRKSDRNRAAEVVRNCVSARPDHTMLMCDFDQIEMRLLAHLSQDPGLVGAFVNAHATGGDFFVDLAREIFEDPTIIKGDARRQITKNAGYSEIYGAGVAKFALTAGVSIEQAQAVKARWNSLYPGTKRFARQVESFAWNAQRETGTPYYPSPVTGRHHVADINKIYALLNYLIQGSAAEVFKTKLLQLDAAGLGPWMVVPVHDEIVLDVPNEHLHDAVQTLHKVMNDLTTYLVPITASVSYGERWGSKEEWKF